MPTLDLTEHSLHYLDAGDGDSNAVLLLHAFPFHAAMWQPQVEALSAHWRVIAPDARGFGGSRPVPAACTMEMIADDAIAILDHLGIERVAVVGLSMGGYAALTMWQRHRSRITALALCDTRSGADDEEGRARRESFSNEVVVRGSGWAADQLLPVLVRQPPAAEIERTVRALIADAPAEGIAAAQRGMAQRADTTALLAGIDVPTAVLCGADDGLTPPDVAREMAQRIPGARYVEIPGAGHLSSLEAPVAFNAGLAELLSQL